MISVILLRCSLQYNWQYHRKCWITSTKVLLLVGHIQSKGEGWVDIQGWNQTNHFWICWMFPQYYFDSYHSPGSPFPSTQFHPSSSPFLLLPFLPYHPMRHHHLHLHLLPPRSWLEIIIEIKQMRHSITFHSLAMIIFRQLVSIRLYGR